MKPNKGAWKMLRHKIFLASSFIVVVSAPLTDEISEIDQQLMRLQQEEYKIQELIQHQNSPPRKISNEQIIPSLQDAGSSPDDSFSTSVTLADAPVNAQQGKQFAENFKHAADTSDRVKNEKAEINNSGGQLRTLGEVKVEPDKTTKAFAEDSQANRVQSDELLKVKAELEKKKDELARVKAENVSLKAKLKMYEDEIRKLSETIDELNKRALVENSSSRASKTVSMQVNQVVNEDRFSVDRALPLKNIPAGTVVYSGPSASSSVLTRIYQDTMLPVYETHGNWFRVITPQGVRGWVYQPANRNKKLDNDDDIEKRALENWIMIGRQN